MAIRNARPWIWEEVAGEDGVRIEVIGLWKTQVAGTCVMGPIKYICSYKLIGFGHGQSMLLHLRMVASESTMRYVASIHAFSGIHEMN